MRSTCTKVGSAICAARRRNHGGTADCSAGKLRHILLLRARLKFWRKWCLGPRGFVGNACYPLTQQGHSPPGGPDALTFHSALGLGAERRNGLFWLDSTTALVAAGGAALLLDVPTGRQTLLDAQGGLVTRAVAVHPGRSFIALAGGQLCSLSASLLRRQRRMLMKNMLIWCAGCNIQHKTCLHIVEYPSLRSTHVLQGGMVGSYTAAAFSADGCQLATAADSPGCVLTIWDWQVRCFRWGQFGLRNYA